MSTTWVFVGLLCGRELAISTMSNGSYRLKNVFPIVGRDFMKMMIGLGASLGIVLSACYGLWLSRRIIFGNVTNNKLLEITDLTRIEKLYFIPLIVLTLFLGILPYPILEITSNSVDLIVSHLTQNLK